NCTSGCGYGDEMALLMKVNGINRREAITLYLEMAGLLPSAPRSRESPKSRESPQSHESPESHECPESPVSPQCPECHESHVYPVSPVSNGQGLDGEKEKVLKALAARNACTERDTARKRRFKLLRDLRAVGARNWLGTGHRRADASLRRMASAFSAVSRTRKDMGRLLSSVSRGASKGASADGRR